MNSFIRNFRYLSYKSNICIEKLYPNSKCDYFSSKPGEKYLQLKDFSGYIPIEKLKIVYSRSSGPGGQHVNTVNTKVDVRFHVKMADWLSEELKEKIVEKHKNYINVHGYLSIKSDKTRSQQLNLADAMDKLRNLIYSATIIHKQPSGEAVEFHRRLHEFAVRQRLHQKRERSRIKQDRQSPEESNFV